MKKIIIASCILMIFSCRIKSEKDVWLKQPNEIKYSKENEKKVWGKILRGNSEELFYGTPHYKAAQFIKDKDIKQLRSIISSFSKKELNFQEAKLGFTLGHFALFNSNIEATRLLIEKGLNPNIISKSGFSLVTSINTASNSRLLNSLELLKEIIKKGGNVNLLNTIKNTHNRTPLIVAAGSNLENTKLLIESGANVNFVYKDSPTDEYPESALISALGHKRIDIVNYLIFEAKVNFKNLKYSSNSKYNPDEYLILGYLRYMTFDLNSEKYQQKMKLIKYLSEQGLDYWKTEIPKNILKNKRFYKEYLEKY